MKIKEGNSILYFLFSILYFFSKNYHTFTYTNLTRVFPFNLNEIENIDLKHFKPTGSLFCFWPLMFSTWMNNHVLNPFIHLIKSTYASCSLLLFEMAIKSLAIISFAYDVYVVVGNLETSGYVFQYLDGW
jgi:hypothetical protein